MFSIDTVKMADNGNAGIPSASAYNRDLTHIQQRGRGRRVLKNVLLFYFGISHLFRSMCLSVLKLAPAEYAAIVFSSK